MMSNYEKKSLGLGVFVRHLMLLHIRFHFSSLPCDIFWRVVLYSCVPILSVPVYFQSGPDYRSEESRRIHCTKCGNSHIWICTSRTKAKARWCQVINHRSNQLQNSQSIIVLHICYFKISLESNVGLWSIPSSERWRWMGRTQRDITL